MDRNFSQSHSPSVVYCPESDFSHQKSMALQNLKEAMDQHSVSACSIAWVMMGFSLFGIFSNSVSLRIFTDDSMRCVPVNVLLAGLSCIDLILSVLVLPVFVLPALNLFYRWKLVDYVLPYVTFVLYPLTLMTQTASVWVFVVITCERWAAVVKPLQARRYSSVSNAKRAFTAVIVMAILYNLIRFGEFRLVVPHEIVESIPKPDCVSKFSSSEHFLNSNERKIDFVGLNEKKTESGSGLIPNSDHGSSSASGSTIFFNLASSTSPPSPSPSPPPSPSETGSGSNFVPELEPRLRYDATYMFFYYFGLYLLTHFAVPFSILLIVNIHVVWTILRTRAQRRRLTTHERREHRIALMMGVVVVAFLVCNTIPFAMNLLEAYDRDHFRRVETLYVAHLVNDIGNLLVVVNSSTTSFIYYAFSQRYRRRCVSNLCLSKKKRRSILLHGRNLSFKDSLHASFHADTFEAMTDLCQPQTPRSRKSSPRRFAFNGILETDDL